MRFMSVSTPGELMTAYNDCYDQFVEDHGWRIRESWCRHTGGRTFEETLVEEFRSEYGVGKYTLVDS